MERATRNRPAAGPVVVAFIGGSGLADAAGISQSTTMANEPETRLRFSLWRPARLDGTYLHVTGGHESGSERSALLDGSTVLEQIYAWDSGPYDLALCSDPAAAQRITDRLLRPFGAQRPPSERQVQCFLEADNRPARSLNLVTELIDDPEVQSGAYWSDCEETVLAGDKELNQRVNAVLGVLRHLQWIARVYADVPSASVLIR